ncbi:alpha/beta fold hydrolase [Planomicrobium sp. CPCC 101079]|uniref:alpha/beta fold hydrolase n=1 Tax=Planomicrobium sp. CPCC 101079 TaxID=2599618 RepID=UPI0011B4F145|nr:alpha/beta hydrolase [Planomicrobium sp. CPCC 101079]TWT00140.1 alpha/beta hydrolase [Planomicrobium sp. CPCC 101079]
MKQFVRINNKKLEILQKGSSGTPILILTGMACSFEEWYEVTEVLSKTNRIIMFHRPGLGESEIGNENRTTFQTVQEITCLLSVLKITEPILLIGHSYGGLCAQHFAKLHSHKVRALILVDSTSEDLEKLDALELPILNEDSSDEEWIETCKTYAGLRETELKKIIKPILTEQQKKLPYFIQQNLIEFQQKPNLYKAMKSEVEHWKIDAKIIKVLGRVDGLPLLVIGRDKKHMIRQGIREGLPESELTLLEETWEQLIIDQAKLSRDSKLIFAENTSHSVYLDRPDLVVKSVTEILQHELA